MVINVDNFKSSPVNTGLPRIKVFGVGGGGGNVVNRMIQDNVRGVHYLAMNTDVMALKSSLADVKLPIGARLTQGLGAGMKPEIGRAAAEEDIESIKAYLENTDLLFLAAGMGGGTGTGAIPMVAEIAKEMGILTVAVVTIPFSFEGPKRLRLANEGIAQLGKHIDTLVVIPNSKLLELASPKTTMADAFSMADEVLKQAIGGITNLINLEGVINLDFADLHTVMSNKGSAFMGTGTGEGDNRGLKAVKKALMSPLIAQPIDGATGVIINIVADDQFSLFDAEAAAEHVQNSANQDADVIFGLVYDPSLVNTVLVTVIATGYDSAYKIKAKEPDRVQLRVADRVQSNQSLSEINENKVSSMSGGNGEEMDIPHFMRDK